MARIIAVVVTYNRKDLLQQCLDSILTQSYSVENIIVIDNASTDGTCDLLLTEYKDTCVIPVLMEKNTGGAGGFYEGIKRASETSADYIWLMDDDTIPEPNCLERMIHAKDIIKSDFSFLASTIYGPNGEYMNLPQIDYTPAENGYAGWYGFLSKGIVQIESATFVSLLVNMNAVRKCGLPCKEFFIWGDDTEYTLRLSRYYAPAYFVGESVAIHMRKDTKILSIETEENDNRINMFRYAYRNRVICNKYYRNNHDFLRNLKTIIGSVKYIKYDKGLHKTLVIAKGTIQGIFQYGCFKKYIESQVNSNVK